MAAVDRAYESALEIPQLAMDLSELSEILYFSSWRSLSQAFARVVPGT